MNQRTKFSDNMAKIMLQFNQELLQKDQFSSGSSNSTAVQPPLLPVSSLASLQSRQKVTSQSSTNLFHGMDRKRFTNNANIVSASDRHGTMIQPNTTSSNSVNPEMMTLTSIGKALKKVKLATTNKDESMVKRENHMSEVNFQVRSRSRISKFQKNNTDSVQSRIRRNELSPGVSKGSVESANSTKKPETRVKPMNAY